MRFEKITQRFRVGRRAAAARARPASRAGTSGWALGGGAVALLLEGGGRRGPEPFSGAQKYYHSKNTSIINSKLVRERRSAGSPHIDLGSNRWQELLVARTYKVSKSIASNDQLSITRQ